MILGACCRSRVEDMDYKDLAKLRTQASEAQRRFLRLEQLVEIRRLYRNMHRAKYLLELHTPLLEDKKEGTQIVSYLFSARDFFMHILCCY